MQTLFERYRDSAAKHVKAAFGTFQQDEKYPEKMRGGKIGASGWALTMPQSISIKYADKKWRKCKWLVLQVLTYREKNVWKSV